MAVAQGYGKTVTSGSVFAYDVADTRNSYIGEPTTNVFVHYGTTGEGSGADNGVSFNVNGTGTFIRLGYGQTFGGYTIKPNDVVYKYNLGEYGCHYHGSDITIPNGKYATFSFDYYISPGTANLGVDSSLLANFENALGGGINLPNTNTGIWQSVSLTAGPTGGGTLRSLLYPGACGPRLASNGYILYKNPQVEFLPHKTPFVQTTRSATQGLLPLVGNSTLDLTNMSFDSNAQMTFDGTDDLIDITTNFGTLSAYTFEYVAYANSGGNMPIASRTSTAFYKYGAYSWRYTHGGVGGEFYHNYGNDTGWAHWVITYDGSTISVWENGISKGTASSSGTADFSGGIRIGSWASSAAYTWDGTIPIMKMYNRALSAGEVRQNYLHYKTRFNLS